MMTAGTSAMDRLAEDIRLLVGPNADEARIRAIIEKASQTQNTNFHHELLAPFRNLKIAFVVVDFQNDFVCGSLSIKERQNGQAGQDPSDAIPVLNRILREDSAALVVYTLDWHPITHISFLENCRDSDRELSAVCQMKEIKLFDEVTFDAPDCRQVLYPTHCVQGSWGSELDPRLHIYPRYIMKGTSVLVDSYSAFQDNKRGHKTNLEETLRSEGITAVIGCGLAYEICVAATLRDSADLGFYTAILTDASKGLDLDNIAAADVEFAKKNIAKLSESEASSTLRKETVPIEWIEKRADELLKN